MTKHTPFFATAKTAAALFEMSPREFLALVENGVFPKPVRIGSHERWETDALKAIVRGEPSDGFEDVAW